MAVTAKRDDMRLLAVVLGEAVSKVRNQETTELLDYGFNLYKINVIKKQGDVIDTIKLDRANRSSVDAVLENDITVLSKKSDTDKKYTEKVNIDEIKLPIKKGIKVGVIEIFDGNNKIGSYPLIVNEEIKKKGFWKILGDNLKDIIVGGLMF